MIWSGFAGLMSVASLTVVPAHERPMAADSVDACALYTREDVAKLAGDDPVQKPRVAHRRLMDVSSSSCRYSTRRDSWAVTILVERGRTEEELRMMLKMLAGAPSKSAGQTFQRMSGMPNEAYWGKVSPTKGMVMMVVGTDFITVETWGEAAGAGTEAKTKEIASTVLERYKQRYGGR